MNTRIGKAICLFFLVFSISVFSTSVLAQSSSSNAVIKGTVKDASGSIVQGADVELVNTGTDAHRTEHSNKDGYFDFAALNPGDYAVTVKAEGFGVWSGKLTLRVAQEANLSPTLRIATAQTSIDVIDVTPVIDRADATLSDVKEAARIETLPLQNRNFLNILNFTPGVVANSFAGQGAGYTRVNGIPGGSIAYLVDGQDASERATNELQRTPQPIPTIQELKVTTSNGDAQYSRPGVVEVVTKSGTNAFHGQIFELYQGSHFAAKALNQKAPPFLVHNEFGGNIGGPVRIPGLYNGKDKTFFFFDAEGIRDRRTSGSQDDYHVPTANWKKGILTDFTDASGTVVKIYDPNTTRFDPVTQSYVRDQFPNNIIPDNRINPVAKKILAYFPDPNIDVPYYIAPNYQTPSQKAKNDSTLYTAKLDQILGQSRLSARYTYVNRDNAKPFAFLNPDLVHNGGHNGTISFTEVITPHIVNEVRAGVQLFVLNSGPRPISPPITQAVGLPTYNGTIAWPGIDINSNDFTDGSQPLDDVDRNNPKISNNNAISLGDNLSWNLGKHAVKFGFTGSRYQIKTVEQGQPGGNYGFSGLFTALQDPGQVAQGNPGGSFAHTGANLADLLLGQTNFLFFNLVPAFHTRQSDYAGYIQDDWKLSPRLILNLGLRYEYWTPFEDHNGRAANLDFSGGGNNPKAVIAGNGQALNPADLAAYTAAGLQIESASAAKLPSSLWNMSKNNLAPRVGFAFQADPKTTFRGGYGFYYWAMPLIQYQQNTRHNVPFANKFFTSLDPNNDSAAQLSFPKGGATYQSQTPGSRDLGTDFLPPGTAVSLPNDGFLFTPWDPNYKPQRVQQYNLTVERELPGRVGARLSYIGNHSDHLPQYDNSNYLTPRLLLPNLPNATRAQRSAYPNFTNGLDGFRWIGYANTNSLQAELKQQVNQDMLVQASFVWQRALTTSEGQNNSNGGLVMQPLAIDPSATDAQRLRHLYAHDSYLPQYTFSFNTHYVLPFGRGKAFLNSQNGLVDRFVSGFNVSAFYYWRSGLYFSPYYGSAGQSTMLAPNKTGALPKGDRTRKHWFDSGVNQLDANNQNLPYQGEAYIARTPLQAELLGNIPRNNLTGPGFNNMDATISKITPITERVAFNLEAQFFNAYNHVNLDLPNINTQGNITNQIGTPRLIQFQGKIVF